MQSIGPSCSYDQGKFTMLPNGHPDMETDSLGIRWAGSVFNPTTHQGRHPNRVREPHPHEAAVPILHGAAIHADVESASSNNSAAPRADGLHTDYTTAVLEAYHKYAAAAG